MPRSNPGLAWPGAFPTPNLPASARAYCSISDARKGSRPSYVEAAPGEEAEPLYDHFCDRLGAATGVFGARMGVALVNDGPVTLLVEA